MSSVFLEKGDLTSADYKLQVMRTQVIPGSYDSLRIEQANPFC